jgi:hypothetical protein
VATISNVDRLIQKLRKRAADARRDGSVSVTVGYTAAYALFVHENTSATHKRGQAKFLEQPYRTLLGRFNQIIDDVMKKGGTLADALLRCGLLLQRESQKLCPVLTGALRASAFTRLERG